jgi:hypothetical protein
LAKKLARIDITNLPELLRVAEDVLTAGYQAVPALKEPLSVEQMTEIAAEEHARTIVGDGR